MRRLATCLACYLALPSPGAAHADDGALLTDDTWRYRPGGELAIDGGLALGFPAALPTGLATGLGAGLSVGRGLAWGARAAWLTATESSLAWTVTHSDLQLRVTGALQAEAGRGTLALRLGLGGTLVHETRVRNQGMRAGLSGAELATSAYAMLPAVDLDGVVSLHIAGAWLMMMSGGPSLDVVDGKLRAGWNAQLGAAWRP
jgi:hypothetical protein